MTLSVKDLSFQIGGKKLMDSVSLDIHEGEIVLLCGTSGSGKSTLANTINGYFPEYGGHQIVSHIKINNEDVQHKSVVERSDYVRTLFQNARLSFSMKTLREEMVFCLENNRIAADKMDDIIANKVRDLKLEYLLDRSFDDLSGGELQRAAFVCADLVDVPLYIMDEPFANVDEDTIQDYIGYMKAIVAKGKSIIIIDHHVSRWDWVDRWLLLGSDQRLHDLSLLQSDQMKQDLLIKEGISVEASSIPEKNAGNEEVLLELDEVSVFHKTVKRHSLFRKEIKTTMLIENAQFNLTKGSLTALVGPSGIGKSSLFKAILNVSPYSGDIRLQGQDIRKMKARDLYSKVGLVFQDPSLQFVKTNVLAEMVLSLTAWGNDGDEEAEREAQELLKQHHFENKADQSPWVLSQGQQRRLAVICMTVGEQQLLLVDEPTYGQDARNAKKIMDKLHELCRQGMTCLFTSHDFELVDAYADTIYEIKEKKVIQTR
ncbi:ABC transporter ATP-binding protein [Alkalibacterium olivapovliticus]|nr:ABC transporter ATP-binding protein [Alkalibacterium olivapovliticus]